MMKTYSSDESPRIR